MYNLDKIESEESVVVADVPFPEEESVSNGPIKPDLHVLGAKDDSGKTRLGLVLSGFNLALLGVGEVGTFGANKYTDNGWKSVPDAVNRYRDAMYRHLLAGDEVDLESGLLHMAHAAWNALAILQFMMEERHGFQNEKETSSSKTDSECV